MNGAGDELLARAVVALDQDRNVEVNHPVELTPVEQLVHHLRVREAGAHELEVAVLLQQCQARLLEAHVVVVIDGIEADHVVAVRQ